MIADSEFFSNSPGSHEKRGRDEGTLGHRILFVSLVLLVVPLVLASLLISSEDYRHRVRSIFSTLQLVGENKESLLNQVVQDQIYGLKTLPEIIDFVNPPSHINLMLQQAARAEKNSSLSYITFTPAKTGVCLYSSDKNLIGQENLFENEVKAAYNRGANVFLGWDTTTKEKQLFVAAAVQTKGALLPTGVLIVGKKIDDVMAALTIENSPFNILLFPQDNILFLASTKELPNGEINIVNAEKFENEGFFLKLPFLEHFKKENTFFGFQAPVLRSSLALLILISEKEALTFFPASGAYHIFILLAFIVIVGGLGTLWLVQVMGKPLRALAFAMEKVTRGDLNSRYKQEKMGFEINRLGEHFNHMIASIIRHKGEATFERGAKEVLENELRVAHEIQKSLFPKEIPHFPHLDIAAGFSPAIEVAGDFYDLFPRKNGKELLMAIGDASGKGVSACLYSLDVRSLIRSNSELFDDLGQLMQEVNKLFLLDTQESGSFVTAWVGIYDPEKSRLVYTSLGHPPALLFRKDGSVETLSTEGIALGAAAYHKVFTVSLSLGPDDLLFLYTDGLTETRDPKGSLFGLSRLTGHLMTVKEKPASEILSSTLHEVQRFAAGAPLADDLTAIAVKCKSQYS